MIRLYAILATIVLAVGLGAMWLLTRGTGSDDRFAQCRSSQIAGGTAAIGGPFDLLAEGGQSVTPLFISIDPDRDTPEVVGDYAFNLHERMIALTGSAEQVKAASQAYKTYYKAHDKSDEYYLVDHSTFTYLVTPQDGFIEFFNRDDTAEQMADKVGCFLDKI